MARSLRVASASRAAIIAAAVGALAILALHASGSVAGSNDALQVMGFDPDRASLITGLSVGAVAAALGALVTGRRGVPVALGYAGFASVFGGAFLAETAAAAATKGPQGFTLGGWLATLVTVLAAGLAAGWAAATLAVEVRRWIAAGVTLVRERRRTQVSRRHAVTVLVPILLVALVVATVPTLADMINYTPDVAMTNGGIQNAPPLVGGSGTAGDTAAGGTGLPGSLASTGGTVSPGSVDRPQVSPGAIASTAPWASAPPAGHGRIITTSFPAPWTGGNVSQVPVWWYLPPGYDAGSRRYPVVYTTPWDLTHWELGIHITGLLDQAITSGQLPPEIVAFVDLAGGPFPNSECADSWDGREHADTFVSKTVVVWADAHLRTIASADARTLAGFSQGGFCAANLLVRHPGVFHQAVIFSGYFEAGLRSGETINSWMPWGHVPSVVAANSPMQTASALPSAVRRQLFVVLSGQPDQGPFGQQLARFSKVLEAGGYPTDFLWNQLGHAWAAVKGEFVPALRAVAARQVLTGVLR